ncbi:MAG: LCP family protein, partial [Propionibacteriaceae bacterium]|nr:LCP family protein [Propionibacteriaceae bacterium]
TPTPTPTPTTPPVRPTTPPPTTPPVRPTTPTTGLRDLHQPVTRPAAAPTPAPAPVRPTPIAAQPADMVVETTPPTHPSAPVSAEPVVEPETSGPQFAEPIELVLPETPAPEPEAPAAPPAKSRADLRRERAEQKAAAKADAKTAKAEAKAAKTAAATPVEVAEESAPATAAEVAEQPAREPQAPANLPLSHSLGRTVLSTVFPGAGLINVAPKRRNTVVGIVVLAVFVILGLTTVITAAVSPSRLVTFVLHPGLDRLAGVLFIVLGLVWLAMIIGTYLLTRPRPGTGGQKAAGVIVTAVLSLIVAAAMALSAVASFAAASTISGIFGENNRSATRPASAATPLSGDWMNILLLGADSNGAGTSAKMTIDTVMVASINVATGNTVLIQLPPGMARTPFPKDSKLADAYPVGFYDGKSAGNTNFTLGAIWNNVPAIHPELFTNTDFPGGDAMKLGVGTALGMQIDYFALLDVSSVQQLVDAIGGVTVNVNFNVAMGGSTQADCGAQGSIPQGANQHLDGTQALWFGRSVCNDPQTEYGLMNRQVCLAHAIVSQTDTTTLVTKFDQIAHSTTSMSVTDIPASALPTLAKLASSAKAGTVSRLSFTNGLNGFNESNPNFGLMRQLVLSVQRAAINPRTTAPAQTPDVCAYSPQK